MKKVFLIGNHDIVIYNFRHELIERLLQEGYEIGIVLPYGKKVDILVKEGCVFYESKIDRRGANVWRDLKLFFTYWEIFTKERPEVILTYTIKPNIYAGIVARIKKIPYIVNITGLGSAIENKGILQKMVLLLYKIALGGRVCHVFFQNKENMHFFREMHICNAKGEVLPGSGVNIRQNQLHEYPKNKTIFVFAGRLMREKGIEEYFYAAETLKKEYSDVEFHICGFCEEDYLQEIDRLEKKNVVIYHGMVDDMRQVYQDMSCLILPSYHEGMSNVLLEAAANGRPSIASDIPGCKEIVIHEKTGLLFEKGNKIQLCEMIKKFIKMPYDKRSAMGIHARKKVEKDFDRDIIVEKYLSVIREFKK